MKKGAILQVILFFLDRFCFCFLTLSSFIRIFYFSCCVFISNSLILTGSIKNISPALWNMTHLTALYLDNNSLSRIPSDISRLVNLTYLDLSSNKLRTLPSELGDLVRLRDLLLNNNFLRVLPYELGKLFKVRHLGE